VRGVLRAGAVLGFGELVGGYCGTSLVPIPRPWDITDRSLPFPMNRRRSWWWSVAAHPIVGRGGAEADGTAIGSTVHLTPCPTW